MKNHFNFANKILKIIAVLLLGAVIVFSGSRTTILEASEPFSGSGTETDPYLIQSVTDMNALSSRVAAGNTYQGIYFKVANGVTSLSLGNFVPIGNATTNFMGNFDGNGAEFILAISRGSVNNVGLFGYTSGATIKNLYTTGSVVGYSYTGAVVGYAAANTTIKHVYNLATVNGYNYTGGIVGLMISSTIEESFNNAKIQATYDCVGGIVGQMQGSTVSNAYNKGEILGRQYIGGVFGIATHATTIQNVYSSGLVSAQSSSYVGGITGYGLPSGTFVNMYYDTSVLVDYTPPGGSKPPTFGNAYGKTTDFFTINAATNTGFSSDIWTFKNKSGTICYYPQLKFFAQHANSNTVTNSLTSVTINIYNGIGTEELPFLITNKSDMDALSVNVGKGNTYEGYYLKVRDNVTDINLLNFNPIGNASTKFMGTFDGNGVNFNLAINKASQNYIGIFGYVEKGTIKNFSVSGSIKGGTYTGAAAGYLDAGATIDNVYNTANVEGGARVGGIVGEAFRNTYILNVYNRGEIIGNGSYVGGIAGLWYTYYIGNTNAYSSGLVSARDSNNGGVTGYIEGSVNSRNIYYDVTVMANYIQKSGYYKPPSVANGVDRRTTDDFLNADSSFLTTTFTYIGVEGQYGYYPQLTYFASHSNADIRSRSLNSVKFSIVDGLGTEEFPILIRTKADMDKINTKITNKDTQEGIYYKVADGVTLFELGNWLPIGNATTNFMGNFDGNGAEFILAISRGSVNNIGLFGYTSGATIKNLYTTGSVVGYSYTGAVVGYAAANTTIKHVYNLATVNGYNYTGGIVGLMISSTIEESFNNAKIQATYDCVGGIVGQMQASTISNAYNKGEILGRHYIGGVFGIATHATTIQNVYNSGLVSAQSSSYVGGITGYGLPSGTFDRLYYDTSILIDYTPPGGNKPPVLGHVYGRTTDFFTIDAKTNTGFSSVVWTFKDKSGSTSYYPQLKFFAQHTNSNTVTNSLTSVTIDVGDGLGTENSPFLIRDKSDMDALSINVGKGNTYEGYYIKVDDGVTDIELLNFNPIGDASTKFMGTFDGNGVNFNLAINKASQNYIGIFGYVEKGTIKNFSVSGSIKGGTYTGAAAGYLNAGATIDNVYNTANVEGGARVGGIVGEAFRNTYILNVYNRGEIIGNGSYVGGIAGLWYTYYIGNTNAYSSGLVSARDSNNGGVTGYIEGSVNSRNIYYDVTVMANYIQKSGYYKPACVANGVDQRTTDDFLTADSNFLTDTYTYKGVEGQYGYYPQLTYFATHSSDDVKIRSLNSVKFFVGDGLGTEEIPILIRTKADMDKINTKIANKDTQEGIYYKVADGVTLFELGNWLPIGNDTTNFMGNFDGNGAEFNFTISRGSVNNVGLFGYTSGATIKNLYTTGSVVGYSYTGAVVGYAAANTTIKHVYNLATVNGYNYTGGIVGLMISSTIEESFNNAKIQATYDCVGGIVGQMQASTISNAYNKGEILGRYYIGGVFGTATHATTIQNVYSSGLVSAQSSSYVGGITGYSLPGGTFDRLYYDTTALISYTPPGGNKPPVLGHVYGRTTDFFIIDAAVNTGFSSDIWKFGTHNGTIYYYPELKFFAENANENTVTNSLTSVTIDVGDGLGTENSPFLIRDKSDMDALSINVGKGNTYEGYYIKVDDGVTDIELLNFNPIGDASTKFMGTFDGNGVNFNLAINKASQNYIGIFGYVEKGTIKNFSVSGSIKGGTYTGAAAGYLNAGATIDNVYNTANVEGGARVGGIVGEAFRNTYILNVYNRGEIIGNGSYVGGIAGLWYSYYIGATNAYSSGLVSARDSNNGGVTGYIEGSVNSRNIYYDVTVMANYVQKSGYYKPPSVANGVDRRTTDDFLTADSNFLTNIYTYRDIDIENNYGYYPQLTYFATHSNAAVRDRSLNSVKISLGDGLGTEEFPILIRTKADMDKINTKITNKDTQEGIYYKVADGVTLFELGNWLPIGNDTTNFMGNFDGNGARFNFTISRGSVNNIGLFGYTSGATIKNLYTTGSVVGYSYTGAVVGYAAANTTIKHVYNLATVNGYNYTGGIVGLMISSTIEESFNNAKIQATYDCVGGIVGQMQASTISNAYNKGEILGRYYIGGVFGTATHATTIQNVYSSGLVSAQSSSYVGGITGYSLPGGTFDRLYYDTTALISYTPPGGNKPPVLGHVYGRTTDFFIIDAAVNTGFSSDIWKFGTHNGTIYYYPELKFFAENANENTVTNSLTSVTIDVGDGLGTEHFPFWITDKSDMDALSVNVGKGNTYEGYYLKVRDNVTDINLLNFNPIGNASTKFMGTFDGNGVNFNLAINKASQNYIGIFGYVEKGTIKNFSVSGSIKGGTYTGAAAGYLNAGATIDNVYNTANVEGGARVGGIVGEAFRNTYILNVYNRGEIIGNGSYVGGIAGLWYSYYIGATNAYSSGLVSARDSNNGGVTGYIEGSVNSRNIYYDVTVMANYIQKSGYYKPPSVANGVDRRTTDDFLTADSNFLTNIYTYRDIDIENNYGYYPQLTYFATHSNAAVRDRSLNSVKISLGDGLGTEEFPILIRTKADMDKINTKITNKDTQEGIYYKVADGVTLFELGNWLPIGNATTNFMGNFDGNGAEFILAISRGSVNNIGLFGYTSGATIKNLYTTGSVVGYSYTGAVVGYAAANTTIKHVYNLATVNGYNYTGGIVGLMISSTIEESFNNAKIQATYDCVGGIVGQMQASTISNAYNKGEILGRHYIGGVFGIATHATTIQNVYNSGLVSAQSSSYVGGITGYGLPSGTFVNMYYDTSVLADYTPPGGNKPPLVHDYGRETVQFIAESDPENTLGFDHTTWEFKSIAEGYAYYPQIEFFAQHSNTQIVNDSLASTRVTPFRGNGTEESPYLITTPMEMYGLSMLTVSGDDGLGIYYKALARNYHLDLSTVNYLPVGTLSVPFRGHFDGNSHTFNMEYNKLQNYVGLFGHLGTEGTVKDLAVYGNIKGQDYVGGVIGNNMGTVSNVYNSANVEGRNNVGGIFGANSGSLTLTYNRGIIRATGNNVGGIAGYNSGTINKGYNGSKVSGVNNVGGVIGVSEGSVENLYYDSSIVFYHYAGDYNKPTKPIGNIDTALETVYALESNQIRGTDIFTEDNTGLNLPPANFTLKETEPVYEYFPQLATFANHADENVRQMSINSVKIYRFKGDGDSLESPFYIVDEWDMKLLSAASAVDRFTGKFFKVYNPNTNFNLTMEGLDFDPIAPSSSIPFEGSFDGNNSTFHLGLTKVYGHYLGLFRFASKAHIHDLTLTGQVGFTSSNANYIGGLVGIAYPGTLIENVVNKANVFGRYYVGGIVGLAQNSNANGNVIIKNVYNLGNITTAVGHAGGVVGQMGTNAQLINAFSHAKISGRTKIGGVVGYATAGSLIINVYSRGEVIGNTEIGGIAGNLNNATLFNAYAGTIVFGQNPSNIGGIVGVTEGASVEVSHAYYDETLAKAYVKESYITPVRPAGNMAHSKYLKGVLRDELTGSNILGENKLLLDQEVWTLTSNTDLEYFYPQLKVFAENPLTETDSLNSVRVFAFVGEGTEEFPFIITSVKDMVKLSTLVDNGHDFATKYIKVKDELPELEMNKDSSVLLATPYKPIGSTTKPFNGNFNGNGANFNLNLVYSTGNSGLFGYVGQYATVYNLSTSGLIRGANNLGSIAGVNKGSIYNVYSTTKVEGGQNVGNIVGLNEGTLNLSYSRGITTGTQNIGGLVGLNNGSDAVVSNAYVSGIALSNTSDSLGAIIGHATANSTNYNLYYDLTNVTNYKTLKAKPQAAISNLENTDTVCGKEVHILASGVLGSGALNINFEDNTMWVPKEPESFNQYYPQLVYFANHKLEETRNKSLESVSKARLDGGGTENDPFLIRNGFDMKIVAELTASGYKTQGKYFKVAEDVDYIDLTVVGLDYFSIGNTSYYFQGHFDGNNAGFKAAINTATSYIGVFGIIGTNGTVKNMYTEGSIQGYGFVGGIAGVNQGLIENVFNFADINNPGNDYAGGIVGRNDGFINNAFNAGTISGRHNVAGISGSNFKYYTANTPTITNVYNTGKIIGTGARMSGIVGNVTYTAYIESAYNAGEVYKTNAPGGAALFDTSSYRETIDIRNAFYSTTVLKQQPGTFKPAGGLRGYPEDYATNPETNRNIKGVANYYLTGMNAQTLGLNNNAFTFRANTGYAIYFPELAVFKNSPNPRVRELSLLSVTSNLFYGEGTEELPYLIVTAEDMKWLSEKNNLGYELENKYFQVLLENDEFDLTNPNLGYISIGNTTRPFKAHFDGNNASFKLNMNNATQNNIGLFGVTTNASTISNLTIQGYVSGAQNVGGLVGNNAASLSNITNLAEVKGKSFAGGIAGISSGDIINSRNKEKVTGIDYTGGIVGKLEGTAKIEHSYNMANITASGVMTGGLAGQIGSGTSILGSFNHGFISNTNGMIGGIVGHSNGTIFQAYSTSNVFSNSHTVGGIAGFNNGSIEEVYSAGIIKGTNKVGGVVGEQYLDATITHAYYNNEIINRHSYGPVMKKALTAIANQEDTVDVKGMGLVKMTGLDAIGTRDDQLNFNPQDYWALKNGTDFTTYYPEMLHFKNSTNPTVVEDSFESITNSELKGKGTQAEPFLIYDGFDMKTVSDYVNIHKKPFTNMFFEVAPNVEVIDMSLDEIGYIPIGDHTTHFNANFNGKGANFVIALQGNEPYKAIFGITGANANIYDMIITGTINVSNGYTAGLIGINNGTVTNITNYANITSTDGNTVGGIIGNNKGTLTHAFNYGIITGAGNYVGGIVGDNESSINYTFNKGNVIGYMNVGGIAGQNLSTINNSYNMADITGRVGIGGIVGYNKYRIHTAFNHGNIYASLSSVGGIVGIQKENNNAYVYSAYNTGSVKSATENAGGIVGLLDNGGVYDTYNGAPVSAKVVLGAVVGKRAETGVTINRSYYDINILANFVPETGFKKPISAVADFNDTDYVKGLFHGQMIGLMAIGNTANQLRFSYPARFMPTASSSNYSYYPQLKIFTNYAKDVNDIVKTDSLISVQTFTFISGSGTEDDPFIIYDENDFMAFSNSVNSGNDYTGIYIKVDPNKDEFNFYDPEEGYVLDPVGGANYIFNGFFDGSYSNVHIKLSQEKDYNALFGHIGPNGRVKNISVSGLIRGNNFTGGIAGLNEGTISNVYNQAEIRSNGNNVGGIAGKSILRIEHAYNRGYIQGRINVGGIAGFVDNAVNYTYNTGIIYGTDSVGAIIGLYNSGIGENNANYNYYDLRILNSYRSASGYLRPTKAASNSTDSEETYGLDKAFMVGTNAIGPNSTQMSFNNSANNWSTNINVTDVSNYPQLRGFASSPHETVRQRSYESTQTTLHQIYYNYNGADLNNEQTFSYVSEGYHYELIVPFKYGHKFNGWRYQKADTDVLVTDVNGLSKQVFDPNYFDFGDQIIVYATWSVLEHEVKFVDGAGNILETALIPHGLKVTPSSVVAPEFRNSHSVYYIDESQVSGDADLWDFDFNQQILNPVTIRPNYIRKDRYYNFLYYDGDDNIFKTQRGEYGRKLIEIAEIPTKTSIGDDAFKFSHWNFDFENTIIDENTPRRIDSEFTTVPRWYFVTFLDGDGTNLIDPVKVEYLSFVYRPSQKPTKEPTADTEYRFFTWSLDVDDVNYQPYNFATPIEDNLVLYPKFIGQLRTFSVTFYDGNHQIFATRSAKYGQTVDMSGLGTPTKTFHDNVAYVFKAWSKDISDDVYTIFTDETVITENTAVFAKFDPIERWYKVLYLKPNKNVFREITDVEYLSTVPQINETPEKESTYMYDYNFVAWSLDEDETSYTPYNFDTPVTGNVILYPKYTEALRTFNVTFIDGNNETFATRSAKYGQTVNISNLGTPTKTYYNDEAYVFAAWSKDLSDTGYTIFTSETVITEDTTVYAKFDIVPRWYKVFYLNPDGSLFREITDVEYLTTISPIADTPEKASTYMYEYHFAAWSLDEDETSYTPYGFNTPVTENITLYPKYTEELRTFNVTFIDGNNETFAITTAKYGNSVNMSNIGIPRKTYHDNVAYRFLSWYIIEGSNEVTFDETIKIYNDTTVYSKFEAIDRYYTITYLNGDGSNLYVANNVEYLTSAPLPPTDPTKDMTVSTIYTFSGQWLSTEEGTLGQVVDLSSVTKSQTVSPDFNESLRQYTVTFYDGNGEVFATKQVGYDTMTTRPSGTPTKANSADYIFFHNDEWSLDTADTGYTPYDFATTSVKGDISLYAKFNAVDLYYTVTFKAYDRVLDVTLDILKDTQVMYDTAAVAPTAEEVLAAITPNNKPGYEFYFAGWDKTFDNVKENLEVNAIINEKLIDLIVTLKIKDEEVYQSVQYGKRMQQYVVPNIQEGREVFVFREWLLNGETYNINTPVTENITLVAAFDKHYTHYLVTFLNGDDSELEVQEVAVNQSATSPLIMPTKVHEDPDNWLYIFDRWDKDFSNIVSDLTVRPIFRSIPRWYTVKFYDIDRNQIGETQTIEYGHPVTPPEIDLVIHREGTTYTFVSWTEQHSLGSVKSNLEVEPIYDPSIRMCTVEFLIDGVVQDDLTQVIEYGKPAVIQPTYTKPRTETTVYIFDRLGIEMSRLNSVVEDLQVPILFIEHQRFYTVKFFKDATKNTLIHTQTVEFGENARDPIPELPYEDLIVDPIPVEGYIKVIIGWNESLLNVREYREFTPIIGDVKEYCSVRFFVDGVELETYAQQVKYGKPAVTPPNPTKPNTEDTRFVFKSWDKDITFITTDLLVNAIFEELPINIDVNYYDGDGVMIHTQVVKYGTIHNAPTILATKTPTTEIMYVFSHWSLEENGEAYAFGTPLKIEESSMNLYAVFTEAPMEYKVYFYNENDVLIKTENVPYGGSATPPIPVLPEPTVENEYEYNWIGKYQNITKDEIVKLNIFAVERKYPYQFLTHDLQVYVQGELPYGSNIPIPSGPERTPTIDTVYTFTGWNPVPSVITGECSFIAEYEESPRYYTLTYYDYDNSTVVDTIYATYNSRPEISSYVPTKPQSIQYVYTFKGWDKIILNVKTDYKIYPLFDEELREYEVIFADINGTPLEAPQKVKYGNAAVEPPLHLVPKIDDTQKYTWTFINWDQNFSYITSDLLVKPVYIEQLRKYTYTFYLDEEKTVKIKEVTDYYGTHIVPPPDPHKEPTELERYEFIGWHPLITDYELRENKTFFAQFKTIKMEYTVTFLDGDGTTIIDQIPVEAGGLISPDVVSRTPTKRPTIATEFEFIGWKEAHRFNEPVYANLVFEPEFKEVNRKYAARFHATWYDSIGEVYYEDVKTIMFEYGSYINEDDLDFITPSKKGYNFANRWDKALPYGPITGEVDFTAIWNPKSYNVLFFDGQDEHGVRRQVLTDLNMIVKFDQTFNLPINTLQPDGKYDLLDKKGYLFLGWTTENNTADPTQGIVNYPNDNTTYRLKEEGLILYAVWLEIRYDIDYLLAEDEEIPVEAPVSYSITEASTLTFPDAIKQGYNFQNWILEEAHNDWAWLMAQNSDNPNISAQDWIDGAIAFEQIGEFVGSITLTPRFKVGLIQLKDKSMLEMCHADFENLTTDQIFERVEFDDENPTYLMGVFQGQTLGNLRENFITENLVFADVDGNVLTDDSIVATSYQIVLADIDSDNKIIESTVKDRVHIVLKGDTNGDGRLSFIDIRDINDHVTKKRLIVSVAILAANVNGDDRLTFVDVRDLNNHITKVKLFWDPDMTSTMEE